jgi:hypothetical protein
MDSKFHLVTLSMDGTHNLANKKENTSMWSYKMKDWAYNILVFVHFA